jgi:hypothetical protein
MTRYCAWPFIVTCLFATAVPADEPQVTTRPAARAREAVSTRVIRLRHAGAERIAGALQGMVPAVGVRPLGDSNTLILSGTPEAIAQISRLIEELDRVDEGGRPAEVRLFPIRNRRAEEVVSQIMPLLDTFSDVRVAADRERSAIAIRGSRSSLEWIEPLITQLDTPTRRATLEFAFFGASADKPDSPEAIPADLQEVAKELRRLGSLRLFGRLSADAVEGEKFLIEGRVAGEYLMSIEGLIQSAAADGEVRVKLTARVVTDKPAPEAKSKEAWVGREPVFTLQTTVAVKRGDYAALGVAPSGANAGQTGVLVMQVQP